MSRYRRPGAAIVGAALLAVLIPSAAQARGPVADPVVTLKVQSVNGSGCPTGSSVTTNVPDQTAFTVSFSQFKVGGGEYRNCVLIVNVAVPAGWTYAVYRVDNRGYGALDRGATGRILTTTWFTGFPWTLKIDQSFTGPFDDFWQAGAEAPNVTYAPCGASYNLTLNDTLRVTGPPTSSMELFAQDVRVSTIFYLRWKTC
jgi:hypothetical protein